MKDPDTALSEAFREATETFEAFDNTAESYETLWDATIEHVIKELSTSLELLKNKDMRQFIARVKGTTSRIERCGSLLKRRKAETSPFS